MGTCSEQVLQVRFKFVHRHSASCIAYALCRGSSTTMLAPQTAVYNASLIFIPIALSALRSHINPRPSPLAQQRTLKYCAWMRWVRMRGR